jgi:hypothetical protein
MELNLHWSLMEKLPKLERGGENHRGTSPMMGKNDSEARKLRELSNGGDQALVSPELGENCEKQCD